jgi:pilus assembly protein TadC
VTVTWVLLALAVLATPTRGAIRGRRAGQRHADRSAALVLDLTAAALRSGKPMAAALELAAPAGTASIAEPLRHVAQLLHLGADAAEAWSGMPRDGPLAEVRRVAVRSASSGLRLAAAFERLATELRTEAATAATARAHRAGVTALGPLAACFLPSFVCLGIVPVVVGVVRAALRDPS